jgi:hypothetical protein
MKASNFSPVYFYIIFTDRLLIADFVCFRNPVLPFGSYPKVLFDIIKNLVCTDHWRRQGLMQALQGSAEFKSYSLASSETLSSFPVELKTIAGGHSSSFIISTC